MTRVSPLSGRPGQSEPETGIEPASGVPEARSRSGSARDELNRDEPGRRPDDPGESIVRATRRIRAGDGN